MHVHRYIPTPVLLFAIGWIALAVVYTTHLGVIPVNATHDECRRALVPLEMAITGDYLTPTINGALYLNKPPLYSMLVNASYRVTGSFSPFAFRLPMVLSLLAIGVLLFAVIRQYTTDTVASLTALAFMANGRALIYDSLLGLLEFTHALFLLAAWMLIYYFGERKKYTALFISAYACAAIAFLLKGLPAIIHVGIGVLVYSALTKNWRQLFSFAHVKGILTGMLILIVVYIPFITHNHIAWSDIASKLFSESAKRYDFSSAGNMLYLLYDFPRDFLRHFLPYTVLIIFLFQKQIRRRIRAHPFMWYCALLFLVNIPIYWLASLKQPHYLYMLVALLYLVVVYAWENTTQVHAMKKAVEVILGFAIGGLVVFSAYLPLSGWVENMPGVVWKSILFSLGFLALLIAYVRWSAYRLFLFIFASIWVRAGFNEFVLPQRVDAQLVYPTLADQIHDITGKASLAIYASYPPGFYDPITYPIELNRQEILPVVSNPEVAAYLLVDDAMLVRGNHTPLLSFPFVYADLNQRYPGNMHLVKVE